MCLFELQADVRRNRLCLFGVVVEIHEGRRSLYTESPPLIDPLVQNQAGRTDLLDPRDDLDILEQEDLGDVVDVHAFHDQKRVRPDLRKKFHDLKEPLFEPDRHDMMTDMSCPRFFGYPGAQNFF